MADAFKLKRVSFENYKSFLTRASLELRPLTIVFGYNSSGKSTLVRLLPTLAALSDTRRTESRVTATALPPELDVGFRDLTSRLTADPLSLSFEWVRDAESLSVDYRIRDFDGRAVIDQIVVASSQGQVYELLWQPEKARKWSPPAQQFEILLPGSPRTRIGSVSLKLADLHFEVEHITSERQNDDALGIEAILIQVSQLLDLHSSSTFWLKANRPPPAQFVIARDARALKADGSGAASVLAADHVYFGGALLDHVSGWYEQSTGFALNVDRVASGAVDLCSLVLRPRSGAAVGIPLKDTGEGMSHVLPVLTLAAIAATAPDGAIPIACIEHPELHLHSRAHGDLATHFCAIASQTLKARPTFILETHSESFLLQLQLEILRGTVSPSDVALHWIRQESDGTSWIDLIEFDTAARPVGGKWPPGLFEESHGQAREILALRSEGKLN